MMVSFKHMDEVEIENEAESRFVQAMNALELIDDETIPDELMASLITTTHEYDWEGLILQEHAEAYEQYKEDSQQELDLY